MESSTCACAHRQWGRGWTGAMGWEAAPAHAHTGRGREIGLERWVGKQHLRMHTYGIGKGVGALSIQGAEHPRR
eukprot:20754-Chlamydomonas_euryale.AAC.2